MTDTSYRRRRSTIIEHTDPPTMPLMFEVDASAAEIKRALAALPELIEALRRYADGTNDQRKTAYSALQKWGVS